MTSVALSPWLLGRCYYAILRRVKNPLLSHIYTHTLFAIERVVLVRRDNSTSTFYLSFGDSLPNLDPAERSPAYRSLVARSRACAGESLQ